jgi:hypothetical protein
MHTQHGRTQTHKGATCTRTHTQTHVDRQSRTSSALGDRPTASTWSSTSAGAGSGGRRAASAAVATAATTQRPSTARTSMVHVAIATTQGCGRWRRPGAGTGPRHALLSIIPHEAKVDVAPRVCPRPAWPPLTGPAAAVRHASACWARVPRPARWGAGERWARPRASLWTSSSDEPVAGY